MYIIVGLGNPEPEYSKTRHNMGFDTINLIAENNKIEMTRKKFDSIYGMGEICGEKVILVKPQTYMNLSGHSIIRWLTFYKLTPENLIVIYDDMDFEKGIAKIRKQGGAGTHNGMKSIVNELGTEEFARIRIGIGEPEKQTGVDFVIKPLSEKSYEELKPGIETAAKEVEAILKEGIDKAMNKFN